MGNRRTGQAGADDAYGHRHTRFAATAAASQTSR
jgi:hypothetical protein